MIASPPINFENLAEIIDQLGVPPERIRAKPAPGEATEADLIRHNERKIGSFCELVDGTMVEKAMGFYSDMIGTALIIHLGIYLRKNREGFCLGAQGMVRVGEQVRLPDVSFYFWNRFPGRIMPRESILSDTPDWAIEVLSPSNTKKELLRKRRELFANGCQLAWELDPDTSTIKAFVEPDNGATYSAEQVVTANPVLPEFSVRFLDLIDEAGVRAPRE